jgi:hypothetical protein
MDAQGFWPYLGRIWSVFRAYFRREVTEIRSKSACSFNEFAANLQATCNFAQPLNVRRLGIPGLFREFVGRLTVDVGRLASGCFEGDAHSK